MGDLEKYDADPRGTVLILDLIAVPLILPVPPVPYFISCSMEYRGTGESCIFRLKFKSLLEIMSFSNFILAIGIVGDVACLKEGTSGRLRLFRFRTSGSSSSPVSYFHCHPRNQA